MHAIGARCERNVRPGIDQKTSLVAEFADSRHRLARQPLQVSRGQVLLPQLHEVNSRASGFCNLLKEAFAAIVLVCRELRSICDVVKKQGRRKWSVVSWLVGKCIRIAN